MLKIMAGGGYAGGQPQQEIRAQSCSNEYGGPAAVVAHLSKDDK